MKKEYKIVDSIFRYFKSSWGLDFAMVNFFDLIENKKSDHEFE